MGEKALADDDVALDQVATALLRGFDADAEACCADNNGVEFELGTDEDPLL